MRSDDEDNGEEEGEGELQSDEKEEKKEKGENVIESPAHASEKMDVNGFNGEEKSFEGEKKDL